MRGIIYIYIEIMILEKINIIYLYLKEFIVFNTVALSDSLLSIIFIGISLSIIFLQYFLFFSFFVSFLLFLSF